MPKSFKSSKSSMRSSRSSSSRSSPTSRGSKKSFFDSKWFYVLVAVVLLVSAVFFFSMPIETFNNGPLSMPRLEYFYMTTCPHCEEFSPIWDDAVAKIKSEGLQITTDKHNINDKGSGEKRAALFKITSAPTILHIHGPQSTDKDEYSGPRTADAIVAYVKSKLGTSGAASAANS